MATAPGCAVGRCRDVISKSETGTALLGRVTRNALIRRANWLFVKISTQNALVVGHAYRTVKPERSSVGLRSHRFPQGATRSGEPARGQMIELIILTSVRPTRPCLS